jgi:hypothetical protein
MSPCEPHRLELRSISLIGMGEIIYTFCSVPPLPAVRMIQR